MRAILDEIEAAFGEEPMPASDRLVTFDGFDLPGKSYLCEHLAGKTQDQVLALLRSGSIGTGSGLTDELELAEPAGIRYYLKPFLVHFAEHLERNIHTLDDELPFFLFAHIANILNHRGTTTFTEAQLCSLTALVNEATRLLAQLPQGIWTEDVSGSLSAVRHALAA